MKQRVKDAIKEKGLVLNRPNRKQGKTLNLCTCGTDKWSHFNNRLGHTYKGGSDKNVTFQTDRCGTPERGLGA